MSRLLNLLVLYSFIRKIDAIIGGEPASLFNWPSYAIIKYSTGHYCGGSMFYPFWIVTSAQCVDPKYIHDSWLEAVGLNYYSLDQLGSGLLIPTKGLLVRGHDMFSVDRRGVTINDVAVIRLPRKSKIPLTTYPMPLTTNDVPPEPETLCITAGFGMSNIAVYEREVAPAEAFRKIRILYEVEQLIVPLDECRAALEAERNYSMDLDLSSHVCARGTRERSGPTYGDFGGPLICDQTQVGVASVSIYVEKFSPYVYTIYAWAGRYRLWLESVVVNNAEAVPTTDSYTIDYDLLAVPSKTRDSYGYDLNQKPYPDTPRNLKLLDQLKLKNQMKIDYMINGSSKLDLNKILFALLVVYLLTRCKIIAEF